MSVSKDISLSVIRREISECQRNCEDYGWEISPVDEENMVFTVKMASLIDNEVYLIEIKFDNYREWPLHIEFVHPLTGEKGIRKAYPSSTEGFFHGQLVICHPCSRKAYKEYTGLHSEWVLNGWQTNPGLGALKKLKAILEAIYFRINHKQYYHGRMGKL